MLFDPSSHSAHEEQAPRVVKVFLSRSCKLTGRRVLYLVVLVLCLTSWFFTDIAGNMQVAAAATVTPTKLPIQAASYTLKQFLKQTSTSQTSKSSRILPGSLQAQAHLNKTNNTTVTQSLLPSAEQAKMKTVTQTVSASFLKTHTANTLNSSPLHLMSSDTQGHSLEVVIPFGALDLSKATTTKGTTPQGALTVKLSQIRGIFSVATTDLGSFQIQIVDGQGAPVQGVGLHTPITLIYHYLPKEVSNLGLDSGKLSLIWPDRLAAATASKQSIAGDVIPMQNNVKANTLTVQSTVLSATPFVVGAGTDPIQTPPKPIFASVQGNGGQLAYSYPLKVASGSAGTAPTLQVTYSSGATNARNAPTTPANNVGEGWEIALGSVTASKYPDGTTWYSINGVDNITDRLIPDTSGTNFATEHLSYLKVKKNTSLNCFQVWDTAGNYYEYGCTSDSLQYHLDSSGNRTNYRYDLDKIIPANEGPGTSGRNLTASYVQDQETSNGHTWIRDAALKQITYGNGTDRIGTIDFFYNGPNTYSSGGIQYVTQYSSTYETNCHLPTSSHLERCDDPVDRTNGLGDPDVMSTLSLQTVKSYVGDDSSNSHLYYSYGFTYQESAFGNCPSADTTLSSAYCAGTHLLSSITPTVYQNGTGHQTPGVTFGYSSGRTNIYDDSSQKYHMENSWNYLTSYYDHSNGTGDSSITYQTAYNNSHGTPDVAGDNRYDSLYCNWHANDCKSGTFYPMDDKMWTMQVVTQITNTGKDSSASSLSPITTKYDYWLTQTQGTCPADTGNPPMNSCVGFGWIPNSGTDWQSFYHGEFRGFGTVLITSPAGDLTVNKYNSTWGWDSPQGDPRNYLAGQVMETDIFKGGTITDANLLSKTTNTYAGQNNTQAACVSTSTYPSTTYHPCEVVLLSSRTTQYESTGSTNTSAPWEQHDYTYDDYIASAGLGDHHAAPATSSYGNMQQEVITASNAPTKTKHWTYDTTDTTIGSTIYYNVHQIAHSDTVDASGHMWQCQDSLYDEGAASGIPRPSAGWETTTTNYSDCSNQGNTALKTYTGYDVNGNAIATVDNVGAANPSLYSNAGCTLSSPPLIFPTSSWSSSNYTTCSKYDHASALSTDTWNALRQHTGTSYDATQGLLPTTVTDINGQNSTTTYSYDSSGNLTLNISSPGETGSYTQQGTSNSACTDSSTVLPCFQTTSASSLYNNAVTHTFYDSMGRTVETLAAGPDASHTIVSFTVYNDAAHAIFKSLPFRVASRNTWLDPNGATDDMGATPGGTSTVMDALERTITTTDTLSNQSSTTFGLGSISGDSNVYRTTTSIDANKHVQISYTDSLGRTRYTLDESGLNGSTLTPDREESVQYNALDMSTSVVVTDLVPQSGQAVTSATTTAQYDDLGRMTSINDSDRGVHTYTYDADDRQLTDVSGTRTIGTSYDLLGRALCIQDAAPTTDGTGNCSSGSHPLVQNTYDTSVLGTANSTDFPISQLTQSVATTYYDTTDYTNKATVTEQYQHDKRGQLVTSTVQTTLPGAWNVTTALPTYTKTQAYNDASQATTTQTTVGSNPGYTFSQAYDATTGQLTGLSNNSTGVANLATQSFNAQGLVSDVNFQTNTGTALANDHFAFDGDLRPAMTTATWQSGSGSTGTIFSSSRAYDAVGNVTSVSNTHAGVSGQSNSGGSETQNFCYDEHNQLLWAGNGGTQPAVGNGTCGNSTTTNTLTGAGYTTNLAYTHLGQLWQGPLNGNGSSQQYLYCNSSHPHQLTGIYPIGTTCANLSGATYTASYDNWGNVTSRTYAGTTAALSYDILDHLVNWNAGSTNQEWYAYDASGNRVLRRTTTGSGTSMTTYAFGLEEHIYDASGNSINNTYYYSLGGRLIAAATGVTTLSTQFFLTDALGSVLSTFSAIAGIAILLGNQLYGPYGNQRYNSGTMGTAKGYTGQYADGTGLDYYNARYYDPIVGLFLSADIAQDNFHGFNPYAYVGGNPETMNDPTGHWTWGDTFAAAGAVVAVVALVTVVAIAAPVLVSVGTAALVGTVADIGFTAIAGAAIDAGIAAGVSATVGEVGLAASSAVTHKSVSAWDIWSTAYIGAMSSGFGWIAGGSAVTGSFWGARLTSLVSNIPNIIAGSGAAAASAIHTTISNQSSSSVPNGKNSTPSSTAGSYRKISNQITQNSQSSSRATRSTSSSSGGRSTGGSTGTSYYTVGSGDSLSAISLRFYGTYFNWQSIYQANRGVVGGNPNLIYPGQRLVIPH